MTIKSVMLLCGRIIKPHDSSPSNARKSLLGAVLCIAVSLIPLVVVLTVSDGMIEGITGRIIGLSSFHLQVAQARAFSSVSNNMLALEDIAKKVSNIEGVTGTFIERQGSVLAVGTKARSGAIVRAVQPDVFSRSEAFKKYIEVVDGTTSFIDSKSAIIGKKIAQSLDLNVGDNIRLITTRTSARGRIIPKVTIYKVCGIVSSGYQEIDALWVFIPLESGFSLLSSSTSQVFVGIEVNDPFSGIIDRLYSEIYDIIPIGFEPYKWSELNTSQYENFASTKVLLLFVMFLIVLVAVVNVSSALVMLVMERRKEIAILKSIGASPEGISLIYLFTGGIAGTVGVLIGIPIGLLCAVNINSIMQFLEKVVNGIGKIVYIIAGGNDFIPVHLLDPAYYLESIPVVVPFSELFIIASGTIILSVLVSLLPAIKAGKEKPLSILRKI